MSGPKGSTYKVESAAERERRLIAAARARCEALESRVSKIYLAMDEKRAFEEFAARRPKAGSLSALTGWEEALKSEEREALRRKEDYERARRLSQIDEVLGSASDGNVEIDLGEDVSEKHGAEAKGEAGEIEMLKEKQRLENSLRKTADMIGQINDDESREGFLSQASRLSQSKDIADIRKKTLLLDRAVLKALEAQRRKAKAEETAAALLLRIAHLESAEASLLRAEIGAAADSAFLKRLGEECDRLIEEHERREDAAYVADQALQVLKEMGYSSGDNDAFVGDGSQGFFAYRQDMPHNALKVQVSAKSGMLATNLVAVDAEGLRCAEEQEKRICGSVLESFARLNGRGVKTQLAYHHLPGKVKMETIPGGQKERLDVQKGMATQDWKASPNKNKNDRAQSL